MDSTFTLRVATELKDAFEIAAKSNDRSGSQVIRDYMREYIRQNSKSDNKLGTPKTQRKAS